ncbi:MAG: hypothetical protein ACI81L_001325 [Verrucomicrobiales bacterium]|jgi:uncharacterized protein (DUF1800 family)
MAKNTTEQRAWIARRLTFGGGLSDRAQPTPSIAELTSPTEADLLPRFRDIDIDIGQGPDRTASTEVLGLWLSSLARPTTSINDWMSWFWHDHFAVSATAVRSLGLFAQHLDLLKSHGLGSFKDLLHAVTIDPAMLIFLDGRRNRRGAVNENYGRELLELYSLGIGNYTEPDVRAAATALTGWALNDDQTGSRFVPRRHDDNPQTLLGQPVDDVDSTLLAVTSSPACAIHITDRLSRAMLGAALPPLILQETATSFEESGLAMQHLVGTLLHFAFEEDFDQPMVLAPVQWLLHTESMTGVQLASEQRLSLLRQMGQVPGVPPNVGGYPGAETWAGPSTTIGRFRAASLIAAQTGDESELLDATRTRSWTAASELTSRPDGFSRATLTALDDANRQRQDGREALAALLMSPELAVA